MKPTKKLEKLLAKYKKANRARLCAYNRRSRMLTGVWDVKQGRRVVPETITDALKTQLNANIEVARLYKLEVSKELRAYTKKKKLHLQWGDNNQITGIFTHFEWEVRRHPIQTSGNRFLHVLQMLKLSTRARDFY